MRLGSTLLLVAAGVLFLPGQAPLQRAWEPGDRAEAAMQVLPTVVSGRYVVAGGVDAVARAGSRVYVGGGFSRIAPRTGSAIVVPSAGGAAEPVRAEVAGGSVRAAVADASGGWYLGGSFTSVGAAARPGLARVRADGTLDPVFDAAALGQVRALTRVGDVLYVGGIVVETRSAFLRAVDARTGASLPVAFDTPARAWAVLSLVADGSRLYAAFGTGGVAAYTFAGTRVWARPALDVDGFYGAGPLALWSGQLVVGGDDASTGYLERLVASTGALSGSRLSVPGRIRTLVVAGQYAYVSHTASPGVDAIDLATGTRRPSRFAIGVQSTVLAAEGTTLYLAGRPQGVRRGTFVYSVDVGSALPALRRLSPWLTGSVLATAPQGGRVLVGGAFAGAGGTSRASLAAFDARTGALTSWRPSLGDGWASALAVSGGRVYVGGSFQRVNGAPRTNLAALTADGTGRVLAWRPRLDGHDSVEALAVARGRVFAGGTFLPTAKPKTGKRTAFLHLIAFSTSRTGRRVSFAPGLNTSVKALVVWRGLLISGGGDGVVALPAGGNGKAAAWRRPTQGVVLALATRGTTLWAGGRITRVGTEPRTNLAAFALDRGGALLPYAPRVQLVQALASVGTDVVYGGSAFTPPTRQALGAVSADGTLSPWRIDMPPSDVSVWIGDSGAGNSGVHSIAPVPDGLFVSGTFDWLGPTGGQAAGGIGWVGRSAAP
jgi:hypothetical protein